MNAQEQDIEDIKEAAENISDDAYRGDYSGRGMYGKICPGIVGYQIDITVALCDVGRSDLARSATWDNMGLEMIAYWPHIEIDDSEGKDSSSD